MNGVFVLSQGQLVVDTDLTIQGNGPANTVIDGDHADRVFLVDPNGTLTMTSVTVRNGAATELGGSPMAIGPARGGGILNLGSLSVTDSIVTANTVSATGEERSFGFTAAYGAGIFSAGTLMLSNSTVSANRAASHVSQPGVTLRVSVPASSSCTRSASPTPRSAATRLKQRARQHVRKAVASS